MITVNVLDEVARLKDAPEWRAGDRHAVSLVKDDGLNVLLMVLRKGARLHEHSTKGPITLHLLSGSVRFTAESNQHVISPNELVALDRGIRHSLEALEESALILVTSIQGSS
jgi:quercetin dioxygenase-like cupin family protein